MAAHGQDFTGQHAGFIGSQLTSQISSGGFSDVLQQLLLQGRKDIGRDLRGQREQIRESGASSGFRGAGANLFNQLFESGASARSELTTGIGREAESQKRQSLEQLFRFNSSQEQLGLAGAQFGEGQRQFDLTSEEGRRQFELMFGLKERELDLLEDSQGFNFGEFLGTALGTAGSIFASDVRLKDNIKYVGILKEGIPIVEFNYKSGNRRFRGVIAQDVEKVISTAVTEYNGIKFVDYSKLSINMQEI